MNWIIILNNLRAICLLVFVLAYMSHRFNWFESIEMLNKENLNSFRNLAIVLYGLFYIIELKLKLKEKDNIIAKLKTKLLSYER